MKKKELKIGDVESVDFFKNKKGGKPICRVNGIIGFIADWETQFCAPGSSWIVEIEEIHDKNVVVSLVEKIRTPYENERLLLEKTNEFIRSKKKEKEKRRKQKANFPYLAEWERRSQ